MITVEPEVFLPVGRFVIETRFIPDDATECSEFCKSTMLSETHLRRAVVSDESVVMSVAAAQYREVREAVAKAAGLRKPED